MPANSHYDVVIIGSGFGGSVAALRLAEKGYRVLVLEAGRRFADSQLPATSWELRRYLWAPLVGCFGIQRIHMLRNVMILAGAGVGGGSLVYANTLYRPPAPFYKDQQWCHITDWEAELAPHYDRAERMLGVVTNPTLTPSDRVMQQVARRMGAADTFAPTRVGVLFGQPGESMGDPYFGGEGPERTGCTECGACMTGCRIGAKNTLVKNYLWLAERAGAVVRPRTTVTGLTEAADETFSVVTKPTGAISGRRGARFSADRVVVAAGTWGTQNLLHRMKADGSLPNLSWQLGHLTRTNSESIIGASAPTVDEERNFSHGVAITSSFHPDEATHIEPCRYTAGANAMALLSTLATDGDKPQPRWAQWLGALIRHPLSSLRRHSARRWSERTVILLVMQHLDNSLTTFLSRGLFGRPKLDSRQGHGRPNPTFIAAGHKASALAAEEIGGYHGGTWGELANVPLTAHFIGGCPIGDSPKNGVLDPYHRAWGHPGLLVVDGSAISANLGVNPSLTITAQAERAMSMWPNKGEPDLRPPQGDSYVRLDPLGHG